MGYDSLRMIRVTYQNDEAEQSRLQCALLSLGRTWLTTIEEGMIGENGKGGSD